MPVHVLNVTAPPRKLPVLNGSYPQDVTLVAGANGSAAFKVSIAEDGKPAEYSYQWYVNGTAVEGANAANYTRTGLTAAATYSVYCAVTNKAGTVNSRVATLTVQSYLPTYTYTGSHELVDEGNYKWKIYLYSSGTLRFTHLGTGDGAAQGFCCGGGGGGGKYGGGGGGYTKTGNLPLAINTDYVISVGAGGATGYGLDGNVAYGGTSSIAVRGGSTLLSASGGTSGNHNWDGGPGGSGGGGYAENYYGGNGGSNGSNGGNGDLESRGDGKGGGGGKGQGTTTHEFGDSSLTLYAGGGGGTSGSGANYQGSGAGGGGGGGNATVKGTDYLGGGGGGGAYVKGGIGRVAIRNRR